MIIDESYSVRLDYIYIIVRSLYGSHFIEKWKNPSKSRCFWRVLLTFGQKLLAKARELLLEVKSSTSRENSRFAYSNSERETFAQGSRKRQRMIERGGGSTERNEATLGTRGYICMRDTGRCLPSNFSPPDTRSNSPSWLATEYERSR